MTRYDRIAGDGWAAMNDAVADVIAVVCAVFELQDPETAARRIWPDFAIIEKPMRDPDTGLVVSVRVRARWTHQDAEHGLESHVAPGEDTVHERRALTRRALIAAVLLGERVQPGDQAP